ncbi:hypothetical protein Pyrfu_1496 [Pyrolobus fumarii 1A]|uniref:PfkB domain protein n=1 Tax=Pyrolobus fumarii (strain DSM 11204 / 1A) TaxID=694429 RepID=G0EHK1_PYRF1|nr:hypothetical protein [Pyrolobus fumarii]AEM39354.1 hypothetical protein Pyrfu_1496 [Pyrolobus fumarii 1A]
MSADRLHVYANPTLDVKGSRIEAGGPAIYAAIAGRILGFTVYVYGGVGRDGHRVIAEYVRRGVRFGKLIFSLDDETTRFHIEYRGDKREMIVESLGPLVRSTPIREPRIVSPVLREYPKPLLDQLLSDAFVDIQGLVRERRVGPLRLVKGACQEFNLSKAKALHGDIDEMIVCFNDSLEAVLEKLSELTGEGVEILLSMGYRGLLLGYDGVWWHVRAWGPRATDPTGMGDVLTSSYAYARYILGLEPIEAAKLAVVTCGLHARRTYEGVGLEDVRKFAKEVIASRVTREELYKHASV